MAGQFLSLPAVARLRETLAEMKKGELTIEKLQDELEWWLNNETLIKAQLATMTVAQLTPYVQRRGTKDDLINELWSSLAWRYVQASKDRGWVVHQESWQDALRRIAKEITPEELANYAAGVEHRQQEAKRIIENPESLEDFRALISARGTDVLTPSQWEQWDALEAVDTLDKLEVERERAAKVEKIETGEEFEFLVFKEWHTKRNVDIWRVKPDRRLDGPLWKEINEKAQRFGARWSSWGAMDKHGWIFFNENDCANFLDLKEGDGSVLDRWKRREIDKQANAVERLNSVADNLEDKATEELTRDRQTNTARRAAMAENAIFDAAHDLEIVDVYRSVASAIELGESAFLKHIRFATQVRLLEWVLYRARSHWATANGINYEDSKEIPFSLDHVFFAKMPPIRASIHDVKRACVYAKGKSGTPGHRQRVECLVQYAIDSNKWDAEPVTKQEIESWKVIAEASGSTIMKSAMADYESLRKAGIPNDHTLRTALREYLVYRNTRPSPVDEARIAELQLVGWKIPGFFPTPVWVADKMVQIANPMGMESARVLEPSAGSGRIADAWRRAAEGVPAGLPYDLHVCEVNDRLRKVLELKAYNIVAHDFLEYHEGDIEAYYDVILMNPPFENNQDVDHVLHAYDLLTNGGILVAIMSEHAFFDNGKKETAFREWLENVGGESEKLPDGTFTESGTGVHTRIVIVRK